MVVFSQVLKLVEYDIFSEAFLKYQGNFFFIIIIMENFNYTEK